MYRIVYLDAIHVKLRTNGHVQTQAVYLALAITLDGQKELLGPWVGEAEGAMFCLRVLTELKNRGVQDILIACVDGLARFAEAIESVYPATQIQRCIVHMVRSSLPSGWKERKRVTRDLRSVYTAATLEAGEQALDAFCLQWHGRFPTIGTLWRQHWVHPSPFFAYPAAIRKVVYTTNAVGSLNAQLRKVTKKKGAFPTADTVRKVLHLAL